MSTVVECAECGKHVKAVPRVYGRGFILLAKHKNDARNWCWGFRRSDHRPIPQPTPETGEP